MYIARTYAVIYYVVVGSFGNTRSFYTPSSIFEPDWDARDEMWILDHGCIGMEITE